MSLCRLSSDDFQCDVYCYESAWGWTGWVTHVAAQRVVFVEPLPPAVSFDPEDPRTLEALIARSQEIGRIVEASPRVPIGLPCDGRSYTDPTYDQAIARLRDLRAMGYRIPENVFAADDP